MSDKIELLDKSETARRARISVVTLDRLIARGEGPVQTRIGGRVFFQPRHVAQWIAGCAAPPAGMTKPTA